MPVKRVLGEDSRWQLLMRWMARATGIEMFDIAVANMEPGESASGYELTWAEQVETQSCPQDLHALIGNGFCLAYVGFC